MTVDPKTLDLAPYVVGCKIPSDEEVCVNVNDYSGTPDGWVVAYVGDESDVMLTVSGKWIDEKFPAPPEARFPDAKTAVAAALNHPRTGTPPKKAVQPADIDPTAAEYLAMLSVGDVVIREFRPGRWTATDLKANRARFLSPNGEWKSPVRLRDYMPLMEECAFSSPAAAVATALNLP